MLTEDDFKNGQVILIDKPLTWTSFQVVNKMRFAIQRKFGLKKLKVGHAGTLDPLASGLLIICTGKFTKKINTFQAQVKTYTGSFILGATTPSYDMETDVNQTFETNHITEELIRTSAKKFEGLIDQKPPIFSAIKQKGRRLYDLARLGETAEIATRRIEILSFEITKIALPQIDFKVVCSKGTYIRSLAYDFGRSLESGAYLSSLRRAQIGDFTVDNAVTLETFLTPFLVTEL